MILCLADNLKHLHGIGDRIQYMRQKDLNALHQVIGLSFDVHFSFQGNF